MRGIVRAEPDLTIPEVAWEFHRRLVFLDEAGSHIGMTAGRGTALPPAPVCPLNQLNQ